MQDLSSLRAVLFDFDGTLADSYDAITASTNHVRTANGLPPFAEAEIKMTTATFWRPSGKNLNKSSIKDYDKMPKEELEKLDWGVRPDPGYVIKLDPKERFDLDVHLREREIIPRRDGPQKEPKPEFKDRQLETALDYLRSQIKTAAQAPTKRTGG